VGCCNAKSKLQQAGSFAIDGGSKEKGNVAYASGGVSTGLQYRRVDAKRAELSAKKKMADNQTAPNKIRTPVMCYVVL
jgi:hypothetical protein